MYVNAILLISERHFSLAADVNSQIILDEKHTIGEKVVITFTGVQDGPKSRPNSIVVFTLMTLATRNMQNNKGILIYS